MSKICYRAVHARAPWRKVGNHSSLGMAKDGPHGARSLLSGGLPDRIRSYGPVACVLVWEEGAAHGWILRAGPGVGEVQECEIPMHEILGYERRQGISPTEVASCFRGRTSVTRSSTPRAPRGQRQNGGGRAPVSVVKDRTAAPAPVRAAKPADARTIRALEELGRVRLSKSFFLRDFLHSEIAQIYGIANVPDDPQLAIEAGRRLCEEILEPLQSVFGRLAIRSGFRSCEVNEIGNRHGHSCAKNESNYAGHIWDRRDANGHMGATACIVVPELEGYVAQGGSWTDLAWWIHDHLPYSGVYFFPKLFAFNISWHEEPIHRIASYVHPKGTLTKPGMANHSGSHEHRYGGLLRYFGRD